MQKSLILNWHFSFSLRLLVYVFSDHMYFLFCKLPIYVFAYIFE